MTASQTSQGSPDEHRDTARLLHAAWREKTATVVFALRALLQPMGVRATSVCKSMEGSMGQITKARKGECRGLLLAKRSAGVRGLNSSVHHTRGDII